MSIRILGVIVPVEIAQQRVSEYIAARERIGKMDAPTWRKEKAIQALSAEIHRLQEEIDNESQHIN